MPMAGETWRYARKLEYSTIEQGECALEVTNDMESAPQWMEPGNGMYGNGPGVSGTQSG